MLYVHLAAQNKEPVDYVNPLIGTERSIHTTMWESKGATFPGVLLPNGMVQITPDGYMYADKIIKSFSFINHSSGFGSYGDFKLTAFSGDSSSGINTGANFNHLQEISTPYLYQVQLQNFGIDAEFTATERVGLCKFTFKDQKAAHFLLSAILNFKKIDSGTISGQCGAYYFIAQFSKPFKSADQYLPQKDIPKTLLNNEKATTILIDYGILSNDSILIKIGFSTVSFEGVKSNISKELSSWDFDKTYAASKKIWNEKLAQITVKTADERAKEIFYTALYHSMFMPVKLSDADALKDTYSALFPWDTHRTVHPLITILDPKKESDMISSVLSAYDKTGWLPTDNMMGNHNTQIILDSYRKGAINFDISKACKAIVKSMMDSPYARREMADFVQNKYVPSDITSSVTHSLEFAYDNWAAAAFLEKTGNKNKYEKAYKTFMARAAYYQNNYNASTGFMEAKTTAGQWVEGGYSEGTPWTYSWYVPHDVQGLINLMGGKNMFSRKLTQCFEEGNYVHDNEPPLHYAYLFNYCGEPWKTQFYARKIMEDSYSSDPGGLPGNDDLGTLSSWYIFSAMGFYPVTPGTAQYQIGSPVFEETIIHLPNGKIFLIKANHVSVQNKYIQSASINSVPLKHAWFDHKEITNGSKIIFEMGPLPNKTWGNSKEHKPYSMTTGIPDIKLKTVQVSAKTTSANKGIDIALTVINKSKAAGTTSIPVMVDGKYFITANPLLEGGEIRTIHVPVILYKEGLHKIKINNFPAVKLIIKKTRPTFLHSDITVPFPPIFYLKDTISVSGKVKNLGSYPAVKLISFYLNKRVTKTQKIFLQAGEEQEIKFKLTADQEGIFEIGIDDSKPEIIRVFNRSSKKNNDYNKLSFLDPVLIMDFDGTTSTVIPDFSGHKNDGNIIGKLNWVDGIFEKGIQTNALTDSYISFPDSTTLGKAGESEQLTMMAWIYPMEEKNFSDIISKGDWNTLQLKGSNQFINFYSNGWEGHEATISVPKDWNRHWHHLAGVADGKYFKLYVDGKLTTTKKAELRNPFGETGTSIYSNYLWNIGRNETAPDRVFNGIIDDVMIFKKDLTQQQIINIMLRNF